MNGSAYSVFIDAASFRLYIPPYRKRDFRYSRRFSHPPPLPSVATWVGSCPPYWLKHSLRNRERNCVQNRLWLRDAQRCTNGPLLTADIRAAIFKLSGDYTCRRYVYCWFNRSMFQRSRIVGGPALFTVRLHSRIIGFYARWQSRASSGTQYAQPRIQ